MQEATAQPTLQPTSVQPVTVQPILAQPITAENFRPYGQMILASADGKQFDREDAQLDLSQGIPRFYIMRLLRRGRTFTHITRHQRCTQCLGSLAGQEWLIAVAPASEANCPSLEQIAAFRVPGDCFIKLEIGTWHAGPYFNQKYVDFYNLELSDTNLTDHQICDLLATYNFKLEIVS
jgi:ureidoglycolate hydrolase